MRVFYTFIGVGTNKYILYSNVCILYRNVYILHTQYIYTVQVHMSTSVKSETIQEEVVKH